jgi:hypothetical protein
MVAKRPAIKHSFGSGALATAGAAADTIIIPPPRTSGGSGELTLGHLAYRHPGVSAVAWPSYSGLKFGGLIGGGGHEV